jgi:Putative ABC-transporter type IV
MIALLYLLFIIAGVILASHYSRHSKRFFWREYISMITPIIIGLVGLIFLLGIKVLYVFLISCVLGPLLEYGTGLTYHKVIGSRLWIYERYPLPGLYTSWLTFPIWGAGCLLIWLIFHSI